MAKVVLTVILALTATKTCLVIDAVFWPGGGVGCLAHHAAQTVHSHSPRVTIKSGGGSPTHRAKSLANAAASKRRRSSRLRLLSMHVTAALSQGANLAKYLLPVSDTTCVATHRLMLVLRLLFDASLVVFLLAKVYVTNGDRKLACWEKFTVWWSRTTGWILIPSGALLYGITFPGGANAEGTFCFNGLTKEDLNDENSSQKETNARTLGANNALLAVQFILLLGLFVKPLLVHVEGAQSGGALYRRVVVRNVICTVGIIASYAISTLIVILALLSESSESDKPAQIRDVTFATNTFATLCVTEISLPLGFASCWKKCSTGSKAGSVNKERTSRELAAVVVLPKTGTDNIATSTAISKVVPLEERMP